jgi:CheY-like chemotaxis protein
MEKDKTILLVEDEEYVYEVSMLMLQRLGYTVLGAKSGAEAVDIFKSNMESIDLVLLDLVMPDMDGANTFDILKKIKFDVNVLLSTGYDENETVEMLMAAGCKGCVQKPFTMEKLMIKLSEIMN